MKSSKLKTEINYINDPRLRESLEILVNELPDYFFRVAASSTGKYHPSFSLGEGGLLRHTKAAVKIGKCLLDDPIFGDKYTKLEQDLMLMSITLHDGIKHGFIEEKYTKTEHPLLAAEFVEKNKEKTRLTDSEVKFICDCIKSHMGPWNTDYKSGEEVLPKPKTKYQNFVHMCDYLSSKKFLDIKFENDEIVE